MSDECEGVVDDVVGDGDFADGALDLEDLFAGEDLSDIGALVGGGLSGDLSFFVEGGVADEDFEHEAVLLCFGEGVGAFLFDGILCGEHKEGGAESVDGLSDGDLSFLHGFEECGLGFGRSAVDFVGENDVVEEWSGDEAEFALSGGAIFLEDIGAGDIGGHEVGSELDPGEGHGQAAGDGADHECFGESWDAFEEHVSLAEEGDEQLFDDFVLADDDASDLFSEPGPGVMEEVDGLAGEIGFRGIGHGW
ncbi:MAG: hypothetical protein RL215_2691 [Planctomycetota bacterium]